LLEECWYSPDAKGEVTSDGEQRARPSNSTRAEGRRERVHGRTLNENECKRKKLAKNLIVNQGSIAAQEVGKAKVKGEEKQEETERKEKKEPPGQAESGLAKQEPRGKHGPQCAPLERAEQTQRLQRKPT
jgi:hypothetical protein